MSPPPPSFFIPLFTSVLSPSLFLSLCSPVDQAIPVLVPVKVFTPVPNILDTTRYAHTLHRLHLRRAKGSGIETGSEEKKTESDTRMS